MGIRPTYTGRLGLPSSRLGSLVPGIAFLWAGPGTFDFIVHVITANKIRVLYNDAVTDTALNVAAYILTSLAPVGTAVTPTIISIDYYDETGQSVVLNLDKSLTYNTLYSLGVTGVFSVHGEEILTGAKNFTANVKDPPIALGAWQSKRGAIDIVFNRSVGPTSSFAGFVIRDAATSPPAGVAMVQVPWATENIPETTLRVLLPVGLPLANAYAIDFTGVIDESLNTSDDTVPVTLAVRSPAPLDYAKLTQLQIIDAFVTDVSNDFLNTCNIRVYFNGPVSDADVEVNWTAYQSGVHLVPDTANIVTSPDPNPLDPDVVRLAATIALVNEIKSDFNNHIIEQNPHINIDVVNTIVSPDAFDWTSVIALINEEQTKYLTHLSQNRVHLYTDTYNIFPYTYVTTRSMAITMAITVKNTYNNHAQLSEYPLVFSPAFGATIIAYTKYLTPNSIMNTISAYTSYADLRFHMDTNVPQVRLEATVTSEDGLSVTSPLDYTGSITARSRGTDSTRWLSTLVYPEDNITIQFDRNISLSNSESIQINHNNEIQSPPVMVSTSLPAIIWVINNAIVVYNMHIATGNAMHRTPDIVNSIPSLATLPLSSIISTANLFKLKLNTHMVDTIYHYFSDTKIVIADDATDIASLAILVKDIQATCITHITQPAGPHLGPGNRMISALVDDIFILLYPKMVNDDQYLLTGELQSVYHDNRIGDIIWQNPISSDYIYGGTNFIIPTTLDTSFIGLATRPSLASAVPRIGLVGSDILKIASDEVELFFSKGMYQVPLSSSNITITGGSILQKEASWIGNERASVRVISMEPIAYTVVVSGLTDEVGNPIY